MDTENRMNQVKDKAAGIYIFGAHSRARTFSIYWRELEPAIRIRAFLVDNEEENPAFVDGIPVIKLSDHTALDGGGRVYLAVRGIYHKRIIEILGTKYHMTDIRPVSVELDMEMRNRFLERYYRKKGLCFNKIDAQNGRRNVCIYSVQSVYDKPLRRDSGFKPTEYACTIQVGAALTGEILPQAKYRDNTGDNISIKNRQFCEETALYWIWKNAKEDIVGLEHYRRHFLLPEDWVERMEQERIDVLLPVPLYVSPNVAENYRFRHIAAHWDFMMGFLHGRGEEEYRSAVAFFSEPLYSPCNMFIMRRNVLNDFCEWLFPILFALSAYGGEVADPYQNRYPAFMAERLLSYFFDRHKDRYKVVYADKNFLG